MRFISYSILIAFVFIGFLNKPERLAWSEDFRLDWAHFKGSPDPGLSYAASTSSGLSNSYVIDGQTGIIEKETIQITAYFYPEYSWYRPGADTNVILKHEQGHFDITEIFARKLRERVANFDFTSRSKLEISKLYQTIEKERVALQNQYDLETKNSRDREAQGKWDRYINDELSRLNDFK